MAEERGDEGNRYPGRFRRFYQEPPRGPLQLLRKTTRPFWITALKIIFFIIFLLIIFFIINLFLTGTAQAYGQRVLVAAENFPVIGPTLVNFFSKGATYYLEPEKIGTDPWRSTVTKNVDNRNLGLEIGRLNPLKSFYYSEEPIEAFSQVEMTSLSDIDIKFECKASKKLFRQDAVEGESVPERISEKIAPEDLEEGLSIFVSKPVRCKYPEFEKEEREKTEVRLELSALYKFTTNAYYDIYVLSEEKLAKKGIKGMDLFESEGIDNPNLYLVRGEQVDTKPVNTPGPFDIKMKSRYSQPLTETEDYFFSLALEKDLSWGGDIRELTNLYLGLPDSFELDEEGDFEFFETNANDNYKRYKLKDSALERVNEICKVFGLLSFNPECLDKIESSLNIGFSGSFRIDQIEEDEIYFKSIRLQAEYIFESSKSTIVPLLDQPIA